MLSAETFTQSAEHLNEKNILFVNYKVHIHIYKAKRMDTP